VEYQKGVTGANVERAVFSNDSALPGKTPGTDTGRIEPGFRDGIHRRLPLSLPVGLVYN
jgi:hypothetical protein